MPDRLKMRACKTVQWEVLKRENDIPVSEVEADSSAAIAISSAVASSGDDASAGPAASTAVLRLVAAECAALAKQRVSLFAEKR